VTTSSILIIDDDALVRTLVRETLGERYQVAEASSGEEGLELLAGELRPALILLDVDLGAGLDGFETCARVRERHPELPVVFLTGNGEPANRERGDAVGGVAYIVKPFSPIQLLKSLADLESDSK